MIEVEGLNVGFGHGADRVHAVRDVSFRVPEGATFGLVGESGSGKSTVLRALSGLNPDWTGRVVIAGGQQGPRRDKAFCKLVQMVFQDPYGSLHPRHTVDRILRSEEHTSELQSLMRISYAVFCLKKKKQRIEHH